MSLFSFHNEFDDVDITLDTEDIGPRGPFIVEWVCHAPEISTENARYEFATLKEAHAKFSELVNDEIMAVLDDGSFGS